MEFAKVKDVVPVGEKDPRDALESAVPDVIRDVPVLERDASELSWSNRKLYDIELWDLLKAHVGQSLIDLHRNVLINKVTNIDHPAIHGRYLRVSLGAMWVRLLEIVHMTFIDLNNSESKCDLNELRSYMLDTTNGLPDEAPASSFLGREEENGQPVVVLYTARSLAGKDVNLKIWTDVQGLECSDEHPIIEWPKPTYRLFRQAARLVCWFMLQREKGQVYQVPKYKALLANLNLSEESPYLPVHSVDEFGDCEKVLGTVFSLDPQTKPCVTLHRAMVTLHADDESLATGLNLKTVDTLPNVPVDSFLEQYDGFNVNSTTGVVHCTRECWRWIWDLQRGYQSPTPEGGVKCGKMKTSYLTALGALPASIVPKDRPGVFILFDQNHVWVQVYKHKLHWTRERVLHAIQCCRAEYERAYPNWRSLANPFFEDWWVGSSSKKKGKAVQYVAKKKPSVVKSGQKAVRSEDIVNQTEVFDLDCEELKADNVHDLDKKKYPNGWKVQPTSASHQNLFIKARRELKGKQFPVIELDSKYTKYTAQYCHTLIEVETKKYICMPTAGNCFAEVEKWSRIMGNPRGPKPPQLYSWSGRGWFNWNSNSDGHEVDTVQDAQAFSSKKGKVMELEEFQATADVNQYRDVVLAKSSDAFGTEVLHVLIDVTEGSTQFQTVDYYDYFEVDEVTLSFISNENFAIYISNYLNWKQKPSLFFLETRRGYAQCHLELTGRKPRDGIPCFILLLTGTVLPMRGTLDWSLLNTAIHTNNELMEARQVLEDKPRPDGVVYGLSTPRFREQLDILLGSLLYLGEVHYNGIYYKTLRTPTSKGCQPQVGVFSRAITEFNVSFHPDVSARFYIQVYSKRNSTFCFDKGLYVEAGALFIYGAKIADARSVHPGHKIVAQEKIGPETYIVLYDSTLAFQNPPVKDTETSKRLREYAHLNPNSYSLSNAFNWVNGRDQHTDVHPDFADEFAHVCMERDKLHLRAAWKTGNVQELVTLKSLRVLSDALGFERRLQCCGFFLLQMFDFVGNGSFADGIAFGGRTKKFLDWFRALQLASDDYFGAADVGNLFVGMLGVGNDAGLYGLFSSFSSSLRDSEGESEEELKVDPAEPPPPQLPDHVYKRLVQFMGDSASRCAHLDLKFTLWLGKQERKVKKMGIKEYGRSLLESVRTQGTKCSGTLLIYLNMARTVCGLGLAVPSGSDKEWIKLPAYLGLWIIRLIRWCLAICRLTGKVVAYVFQEQHHGLLLIVLGSGILFWMLEQVMIWSALLWGYHFAAFNSILEVIGSANDKIGHISYTSCILIIGLMAIYWKRLQASSLGDILVNCVVGTLQMKFVFIYFLYYVFLVGWVIVTLGIAYKMNAIPTAVLTRVRAKVVGLVDARHVTREQADVLYKIKETRITQIRVAPEDLSVSGYMLERLKFAGGSLASCLSVLRQFPIRIPMYQYTRWFDPTQWQPSAPTSDKWTGLLQFIKRQCLPKAHYAPDKRFLGWMERLRDHWISLAIAAMAKIEWLSFEEWLCKHVETDKHEVYRQGWEYFQNTNKIPMVMGWFAKPVEFQFKDNLDMKCRSIQGPSGPYRALLGWCVYHITLLFKCMSITMGRQNLCGKSALDVINAMEGELFDIDGTVGSGQVNFHARDGSNHDAHQHRELTDLWDKTIFKRLMPLVASRLGFSSSQIVVLSKALENANIKFVVKDPRFKKCGLAPRRIPNLLEVELLNGIGSGLAGNTSFGNTYRTMGSMMAAIFCEMEEAVTAGYGPVEEMKDYLTRLVCPITVFQAGDDSGDFVPVKYDWLYKKAIRRMYASIPGEANGTGQFCKAFESWKGLQGSILSRRFYIAGRGCSCFLRLPERYHFTAMLNVKDTVSNAEIMAGLYKEGKHWAQGAYGVGTIHDSWAQWDNQPSRLTSADFYSKYATDQAVTGTSSSYLIEDEEFRRAQMGCIHMKTNRDSLVC